MSDTDKLFAGSIPEVYDTYLVPLIFETYADNPAGRPRTRRLSSGRRSVDSNALYCPGARRQENFAVGPGGEF